MEYVGVTETFSLQSPQRPPQLLGLVPDHVGAEVSICTVSIPLLTKLPWEIEDQRHRHSMKLARQLNHWLARIRLHVGGVNCRPSPQGYAQPGTGFRDEPSVSLHCPTRHEDVVFQVISSLVAHSVDLPVRQDVQGLGILYLSVIAGEMNLKVCELTKVPGTL